MNSDRSGPALGAFAEQQEATFDHGMVSRFNAWFFTAFAGYINHITHHHKQAAFGDIERDSTVLEIGAGTGANLHYLRGGRFYALEPSVRMHDRLRRRCAAAGVDVTILGGRAENIPLPDASVDEVICSLVLCTTPDPGRVLHEVLRVLRPDGRFRFVEHVAAPRRGLRAVAQRLIRRPWEWLFEGCDPGRHTVDTIQETGFTEVQLERRKLRHSPFWPVNTAAWGVATR